MSEHVVCNIIRWHDDKSTDRLGSNAAWGAGVDINYTELPINQCLYNLHNLNAVEILLVCLDHDQEDPAVSCHSVIRLSKIILSDK